MDTMLKNIIWFKEEYHYTYSDIENAICSSYKSLTKNEVFYIVNSLQNEGVIKKIKLEESKCSLHNASFNVGINRIDCFLKFSFVGVIFVQNIAIYVYPKYIDNFQEFNTNEKLRYFKQICNVIEKYNERSNMLFFSDLDDGNVVSSHLQYSFSILKHYFSNGIYQKMQSGYDTKVQGEIDWNKTIDEVSPYIQHNKPYYIDVEMINAVCDRDYYITKLEEVVLSDITREFSKLGIFELFNLKGIEITPLSLLEFDSDINHINILINKELQEEFVTSRRELLIYIYKYINEMYGNDRVSDIFYYGTNSFNLIWQDVCSFVLGDIKDSYVQLIDHPYWVISNGDSSNCTNEAPTLRPDCIVIKNNCFIILDSKYYIMRINEDKISGIIGVEDIVKQYAYLMAFQEKNIEIVTSYKNVFIVPMLSSKNEMNCLFGVVTLPFLEHITTSHIDILELNVNFMFNCYLNDVKNNEVLDCLFNK